MSTLSIKARCSLFLTWLYQRQYRARDVQLAGVHVLDEGDVIVGMPVEAVAHRIEGDRLKEFVDRGNDLKWRSHGQTCQICFKPLIN